MRNWILLNSCIASNYALADVISLRCERVDEGKVIGYRDVTFETEGKFAEVVRLPLSDVWKENLTNVPIQWSPSNITLEYTITAGNEELQFPVNIIVTISRKELSHSTTETIFGIDTTHSGNCVQRDVENRSNVF